MFQDNATRVILHVPVLGVHACVCVGTCAVKQIGPVVVVIIEIWLRLVSLPTLDHLQPLVVVETELL